MTTRKKWRDFTKFCRLERLAVCAGLAMTLGKFLRDRTSAVESHLDDVRLALGTVRGVVATRLELPSAWPCLLAIRRPLGGM